MNELCLALRNEETKLLFETARPQPLTPMLILLLSHESELQPDV
jgi:hypothetical protein